MRPEQCGVVLRLAIVVAVFLTSGFAVGTPPHAPASWAAVTAAAQDVSAAEAALGLDRPTRRLIQQGLRNEGFDPGMPDGLLGPRTPQVANERTLAGGGQFLAWCAAGGLALRQIAPLHVVGLQPRTQGFLGLGSHRTAGRSHPQEFEETPSLRECP